MNMQSPYPMPWRVGVPATPSRSRPSGPAPTGLSGSAASITDADMAWFDRYRPGAVRVAAPVSTVKCGTCEGSGKAWSGRHANDPCSDDGPDCEACSGRGDHLPEYAAKRRARV